MCKTLSKAEPWALIFWWLESIEFSQLFHIQIQIQVNVSSRNLHLLTDKNYIIWLSFNDKWKLPLTVSTSWANLKRRSHTSTSTVEHTHVIYKRSEPCSKRKHKQQQRMQNIRDNVYKEIFHPPLLDKTEIHSRAKKAKYEYSNMSVTTFLYKENAI